MIQRDFYLDSFWLSGDNHEKCHLMMWALSEIIEIYSLYLPKIHLECWVVLAVIDFRSTGLIIQN